MKTFKLDSRVSDLRRATPDILEAAVLAGAEVVRNHAKLNIRKTFSIRSRGGAGLAGSMNVKISKRTKTGAFADVGPTKIYGRIQELGGVIVPIRAKLLSRIDPETGERRFAKSVTLPARPYLRPAVDENIREIARAMEVTIKAQTDKVLK